MKKRQQAPGELEHVRAFVNTLDLEQDDEHLDSASALGDWLAEHELVDGPVRATNDDLRTARDVREALREVLEAHAHGVPAGEPAATLDAAARRARLELRFDEHGRGQLAPAASGVAGGLGRLLAIVDRAMATGTWDRLKACRRESCRWAFYDNTKNHSGVWCNMGTCGNRAKARAYRARHAAS
jgi:predicted RNA-binding Zn ribbon-like protein